VGATGGGARSEGGRAQARENQPQHHRQGDPHGRDAEGHHLGGRLSGAEPGTRRESAQHADALEPAEPRGGYRIHHKTSRPSNSTPTGTHNWASRIMAASRGWAVTAAPTSTRSLRP